MPQHTDSRSDLAQDLVKAQMSKTEKLVSAHKALRCRFAETDRQLRAAQKQLKGSHKQASGQADKNIEQSVGLAEGAMQVAQRGTAAATDHSE